MNRIKSLRLLILVALGVVLVLLLLALLGNVFFEPVEREPREREPTTQAEARKARGPVEEPATNQPSPVERTLAAGPALPAEESTWKVEGPTPFVRRLEAGKYFLALLQNLDGPRPNEQRVDGWMRAFRKHLLHADGRPPTELRAQLEFLTDPRRDRGALFQHDGPYRRVRVWTKARGFDLPTLGRTGELLEQLISATARPMKDGIDILVTPKMGADVFPEQYTPLPAAGVYFPRDGHCVVRSKLPKKFREQVIRHELVHAYTMGPCGLRAMPRFLGEGMAEYLRFLGPRDGGLRIPASAFRDHLARLQQTIEMVEAMGIDLTRVSPERLVRLKPWDFYSLPQGYALAQAMHVYVGGDPLLATLRAGSPRPLVRALESVDWTEFRAWLKREADGGDAGAAEFVRDIASIPVDAERSGRSAWHSYRAIGAKLPANPQKITKATVDAMRQPDQVNRIIRILLAEEGGPVTLIAEQGKLLRRSLGSVEVPDAWNEGSPANIDTTTGQKLVSSVKRCLFRIHGGEAMSFHGRIDQLPKGLEYRNSPRMRLVICLAERRQRTTTNFLAPLVDLIPPNATVLIVDLAKSRDSAAEALARLLAERGPGLPVAYWRP